MQLALWKVGGHTRTQQRKQETGRVSPWGSRTPVMPRPVVFISGRGGGQPRQRSGSPEDLEPTSVPVPKHPPPHFAVASALQRLVHRCRKKPAQSAGFVLSDGGADRIRTCDPHNAIVVLYQLSYDPVSESGRDDRKPCGGVKEFQKVF